MGDKRAVRTVAAVAALAAALLPARPSAGASPQPPTPALHVMNADGTNQRLVVEPELLDHTPPAWSPDGTRLAYSEYAEVHVVDISSGATTVAGPGFYPAWSPTSEEIASVVSGGQGVRMSLVVSSSDGEASRVVSTMAAPGLAAWSPDGRSIAFHSCGQSGCENYGVSVIDADGTGERLIAAEAGWPSWSPDGRALVLTLRNGDLRVVDLESGAVRNLTPGEETFGYHPQWGALGRIAYLGPAASGHGFAVWLVDPDGTDRVMVHEGGGARWSPDGSKLVFVGPDGDLRIHSPGTAGTPVLAPGGESEGSASWSPDGRSIAYLSEERWPDWPEYERSVSVSATRRSVRARVVAVTEEGTGMGCASATAVRLERRTEGEWVTEDKARTDGSGRVRWDARGLTGRFRVRAPERWMGYPGDGPTCLEAASPPFRLASRGR